MEQTALLLGFLIYEVQLLTRLKYLHPLGQPAANGYKYFSAVEIEKLARDREWLDRASRAVSKAIKEKNMKSKSREQQLAA